MKTKEIENELRSLYDQMQVMTYEECQKCPIPFACCFPRYCRSAQEFAKQHRNMLYEETDDYKSSRTFLPMIKINKNSEEHRCQVSSWCRPTCTFHTCEISSLGYKRNDPEWTQKYHELKRKIIDLELEFHNALVSERESNERKE